MRCLVVSQDPGGGPAYRGHVSRRPQLHQCTATPQSTCRPTCQVCRLWWMNVQMCGDVMHRPQHFFIFTNSQISHQKSSRDDLYSAFAPRTHACTPSCRLTGFWDQKFSKSVFSLFAFSNAMLTLPSSLMSNKFLPSHWMAAGRYVCSFFLFLWLQNYAKWAVYTPSHTQHTWNHHCLSLHSWMWVWFCFSFWLDPSLLSPGSFLFLFPLLLIFLPHTIQRNCWNKESKDDENHIV